MKSHRLAETRVKLRGNREEEKGKGGAIEASDVEEGIPLDCEGETIGNCEQKRNAF